MLSRKGIITLTLALSLRERGLVGTFAYPCQPIKGEGTYEIVILTAQRERPR